MSTSSHESKSLPAWRLGRGQVMRLPRRRTGRQLWVTEGRVWATSTVRAGTPPPEDVWLEGGQWHLLPAGTEWLLEAERSAGFLLLEAPAAA